MSRENDLLKNTMILGFGKLLPKFVAIITLPIITAQLTKAEYGTYDLISTLVMLLLPIATLQIQSAAFRFLIDCRGDKESASRIISTIFAVTVPASLLVAVLAGVVWTGVSVTNRILFSVYLVTDIGYLTVSQVARGLSFVKAYSISAIVLSVVNCICVVITLQLTHQGLGGAIGSLIVANIAATGYLTVKIRLPQYLKRSAVSRAERKQLISYSWPMIPNNLSNWILKLSDRVVITAVLGIEANAVYAVANKIPNLLSMAQSILVMAWQENASIAVRDADAADYYSKMFDQVLSLMFGCTALLIGFTPVIFALFVRGDYDDAYVQMPVLILGMFFYCMSAFQGGIYVAHKRTKSVGMTTVAAAAVNLTMDVLLVEALGIIAGSLSTLTAYLLLYLYRLVDVRKFQPIRYSVKKQGVFLAILCVMLAMCFPRNFYLDLVNMGLGVAAFAVMSRGILRRVLGRG